MLSAGRFMRFFFFLVAHQHHQRTHLTEMLQEVTREQAFQFLARYYTLQKRMTTFYHSHPLFCVTIIPFFLAFHLFCTITLLVESYKYTILVKHNKKCMLSVAKYSVIVYYSYLMNFR